MLLFANHRKVIYFCYHNSLEKFYFKIYNWGLVYPKGVERVILPPFHF